jgi:hypothetical protein
MIIKEYKSEDGESIYECQECGATSKCFGDLDDENNHYALCSEVKLGRIEHNGK